MRKFGRAVTVYHETRRNRSVVAEGKDMLWQHLRHFVAGRLSRRRYLWLHLTVGLLFSLALVFVFSRIVRDVSSGGALTRFDTSFGLALAEDRRSLPALRAGHGLHAAGRL